MSRRRKRHGSEQIVRLLRDADAMLAGGKTIGEVCQALEISEQTFHRCHSRGRLCSRLFSDDRLNCAASLAPRGQGQTQHSPGQQNQRARLGHRRDVELRDVAVDAAELQADFIDR